MFVRHLSGGELTEYADGEMVGARRRRVHAHLSRCERCASALDAIWGVVEEVHACREADVPYDLRLRIVSRVSTEALRPISCCVAGELIQQDLDGALSSISAGLLRLHLGHCPACAEQQRTLGAATRLVRSLPPVPAPPGTWERVVASRRTRPSLSWGVRLRPVFAAAAMAAGAVLLGLHSLPQPAGNPVSRRDGRPAVPRSVATAPTPAAPEPVVTQPVEPALAAVASAEEGISRAPAMVAPSQPRPLRTVRAVTARHMEQPPVTRVIAIASARPDSTPKVETAVVQPRKSQGLRALAMMAKAVSSESEGRVSLARQLEPWEVFGDETISEVPLTAAAPADAPGADSSDIPSGQPNTGAREVRPGVAEGMQHVA